MKTTIKSSLAVAFALAGVVATAAPSFAQRTHVRHVSPAPAANAAVADPRDAYAAGPGWNDPRLTGPQAPQYNGGVCWYDAGYGRVAACEQNGS